MTTTVKPCDCKHEFQDKEYGKGMRVHSLGADQKTAVCTVCGKGGRKTKK